MTGRPSWDSDAFRGQVQEVLDSFVEDQRRALQPLGPDAVRLVEAARESVSGGKRLRAMFCRWGHAAVAGGTPGDEDPRVLRACAALELLHASALVHDDLMDASDTRRGRPSAHRAFEARHRGAGWRGDAAQYGEAAAILLGDLLLVWSDQLLRTCGSAEGVVLEAMRHFDTARTEVVTGQFLDVSVQARGDSDAEQSMRVLRYKSAKYTVERPLHVGAALAGGSAEQLAALSAYGLPVGEAFQLRDDLLGVFGDPAVTGKPAGDDLTEGKRTVLVALALEALPQQDRALLDESLGRNLGDDEVAHLQRLIRASGAAEQVERRIARLTAQALAALDAAPVADQSRAVLRDLATAATQREV